MHAMGGRDREGPTWNHSLYTVITFLMAAAWRNENSSAWNTKQTLPIPCFTFLLHIPEQANGLKTKTQSTQKPTLLKLKLMYIEYSTGKDMATSLS